MTSKQFFIERIDPAAPRVWLEGAENHHLARVARIKAGEEVWIFDRRGNRYRTEVEAVGKDRSRLRLVGSAEAGASIGLEIVVGQGLIKPRNMDLVVQKAAELGVRVFVPLVTSRSLHGREGDVGKKAERWRRIALEAAKQSRRSAATAIELPTPVDEFAGRGTGARKLYLSESGGKPLRDLLTEGSGLRDRPSSVVLLCGPEGGWTAGEENMLKGSGFEAVSLGKTVVRAETATIAAVGMISHFWSG